MFEVRIITNNEILEIRRFTDQKVLASFLRDAYLEDVKLIVINILPDTYDNFILPEYEKIPL